MLKSGSSQNLVPFPISNTKGGERGVLKASRLDQEEGQLIQLLGLTSKPTNKLVSSHSESLLVLGQATGNTDSLDSPQPGLKGSHHFPSYSILYVVPRHPHPNGSCKAIFDIYTSRPFQWYKEHLKAKFFDPCNRSLKFRESRKTPSSHFWECKSHLHTCLKVGL